MVVDEPNRETLGEEVSENKADAVIDVDKVAIGDKLLTDVMLLLLELTSVIEAVIVLLAASVKETQTETELHAEVEGDIEADFVTRCEKDPEFVTVIDGEFVTDLRALPVVETDEEVLGDSSDDCDPLAELERDGEVEDEGVSESEKVVLTVILNDGAFVLELNKLSVGVIEKVSFDDGVESTLGNGIETFGDFDTLLEPLILADELVETVMLTDIE